MLNRVCQRLKEGLNFINFADVCFKSEVVRTIDAHNCETKLTFMELVNITMILFLNQKGR